MSARVLVIGLDALEVDLVDELVAAGRMPTIAALADSAATVAPTIPLDTLPGAIWPELCTGVAGSRSGLFFHPRQLQTGEARPRPLREDEVDPEGQYWVRAARAGQHVLAVDMPQSAVVPGLPGAIQVAEWAVHDRLWGTRSDPPEVVADIEAAWGGPLIHLCDLAHDTTYTSYRQLRDDLLTQVDRKAAWLGELVAGDTWDLVTCTFGEAHCGGHQLLHLSDPANRWHEPDTPADLLDAVPSIYEALDRAAGAVIAAAGPGATVILVASHGMADYIGGYQLIEPVLQQLWTSPVPKVVGAPTRWPSPVRAVARTVVPASLRRRRRELSGDLEWPLESSRTKAVSVANNRIGGVRLNLRGREPFGSVAPGAEAAAVIEQITDALEALEQPGTGERLVTAVVDTDVEYGADRHPDLPDLIIRFRRDLGPLETAWSERTGTIERPLRHHDLPRSGDHTDHSRWWIRAAGIGPGPLGDAAAVDLGPTVLGLLGIDVGDLLDGRPLLSS